MAINEDTCLHGDGCADVCIVGTDHYADGFCSLSGAGNLIPRPVMLWQRLGQMLFYI